MLRTIGVVLLTIIRFVAGFAALTFFVEMLSFMFGSLTLYFTMTNSDTFGYTFFGWPIVEVFAFITLSVFAIVSISAKEIFKAMFRIGK